MHNLKEYTAEGLNGLCEYWKHKLGLQNWRIEVETVSSKELSMRPAEVYCVPEILKARIKILDHYELSNCYFQEDIEEALVHELLDLMFLPFGYTKERTLESIMFEQCINILARLLVQYRKTEEKFYGLTDKSY